MTNMKSKTFKRIASILVLILIILFTIIFVSFYLYVSDYNHSTISVNDYKTADKNINIIEEDDGFYIKNEASDKSTIIVFYPGAKIESNAYIPLMFDLAKEGFDSYIVTMPFNLAIFDINAFNKIYDHYQYKHWYLMGHSLGGAMASYFTKSNYNRLDGLILLAAYSTKDLKDTHLPVLSIYGSKDGILNLKKYNSNKSNLPENFKEVVINGGNHAGFGDYLNSDSSDQGNITSEEQQIETSKIISQFINENN